MWPSSYDGAAPSEELMLERLVDYGSRYGLDPTAVIARNAGGGSDDTESRKARPVGIPVVRCRRRLRCAAQKLL
jgi:hypothetical protein